MTKKHDHTISFPCFPSHYFLIFGMQNASHAFFEFQTLRDPPFQLRFFRGKCAKRAKKEPTTLDCSEADEKDELNR